MKNLFRMCNNSDFVTCIRNSNSSPDTIIHGLGGVIFWGAQTYMYVNIVHFFACVLVTFIYCALPTVNKNLYNRIVLRHNVSLLILGGILTVLGYCQVSECPFNSVATRVLWLSLQYFSNATVFWLNIVCFDITLTITRFCRIPNTGDRKDEDRKLIVYSMLVWGGALIPTMMAAIFEFVPQIPKDFILKANFMEASNGPKPIVNMYFFLLPACTLLFNNLLFVVTTYKIIKIQKSTELAVHNQKRLLREKYFIFLRLYLLMGAPWFFGTVMACLNMLVLLKICRTVQPVLWLFMLISHNKMKQYITNRLNTGRNCKSQFTQSNERLTSKVMKY